MEKKDYSKLDDHQLIELMRGGDQNAFKTIYNLYWKKMLFVAANKLDNDIAAAEDIIQEIFVDIWNRRAYFNIMYSLNSYLAAATKYKVIDSRIKKRKLHNFNKEFVIAINDNETSPIQKLSFEELRSEIERTIERLPEKCKLVYRLKKEDGYTQKEIAKVLELSEKTVEAHISRASKFLKSHLKERYRLGIFLIIVINYLITHM